MAKDDGDLISFLMGGLLKLFGWIIMGIIGLFMALFKCIWGAIASAFKKN